MSNQNVARRVRIVTHTVGQSYGVEAAVKALNGRTIATTQTRPLGCDESARRDAEDLCARNGWAVAS